MIRKLTFFPIIILLLQSCGGDKGTPAQNPGLSGFNVPTNIIYTDSITVSVAVSDPQGADDIDSVWGAYGYLDNPLNSPLSFYDDATHGDTSAGDGIYSICFMPAAGTFELGFYRVQVSAVDLSGNSAGNLDDLFWSVEGVAPILFDAAAPDSILRGSQDPSYVTVRVYDVDGLASIDSVYFTTLRPDSTSNGMHFHMADDGHTFDDQIANDGRFTFAMVTDVSNQAGDYTFTFYSYDAQGHPSNSPSIIITLY